MQNEAARIAGVCVGSNDSEALPVDLEFFGLLGTEGNAHGQRGRGKAERTASVEMLRARMVAKIASRRVILEQCL